MTARTVPHPSASLGRLSLATRIARWIAVAPTYILVILLLQCVVLPSAAFVFSEDIDRVGAQAFKQTTALMHNVLGTSDDEMARVNSSIETTLLRMENASSRRMLGIMYAMIALVGAVLASVAMVLFEATDRRGPN